MKKTVIAALLLISLILPSCRGLESEKTKNKYTAYSFDYFDTATTIVGYTETEEEFNSVVEEIEATLLRYHQLYDIYKLYDGVDNLCMLNVEKEIKADDKIIDMLLYAKEMYNKTDGKVNVAMGSVLSIWHAYRERGMDDPAKAELPPMEKLEEAAQHCDIDKVIVDSENKTVRLDDPKMKLDVGAIAKGYAVEMTAKMLEDKGVDNFLLNVGGNIRAVGSKPDGEKWLIGIENPDTENEDVPYIEYLASDGYAVVTSGCYQRYYYVDGQRYHHIIDPATLMPGTNFLSVSVICPDSGMGDALSTALFSMSLDEGKKLIEKVEGAEALWVLPNGEKAYSSSFESYITEAP